MIFVIILILSILLKSALYDRYMCICVCVCMCVYVCVRVCVCVQINEILPIDPTSLQQVNVITMELLELYLQAHLINFKSYIVLTVRIIEWLTTTQPTW